MRRLEVFLPPAKLDELKEALAGIGVDDVILSEVSAVVPDNRGSEVYRGSLYVVDFTPKVKLDLVVEDSAVPGVLDVVRPLLGKVEAGGAGALLSEVVDIMRIRTAGQAEGAPGRPIPSLSAARS
jgi:nitrogen regulatory protein PII